MTSDLTHRDHLEGLRVALVAFVRHAERAGLAAAVPTTPDWSVRRLAAHLGMVHRWSAAVVRGEDVTPAALEQQGIDAPDPLEWLRDGAIEVVTAISGAPSDLDAMVFLPEAPAARDFWARRQCHETTVHAVDALAAALGRRPTAADADWITAEVALDGIDELLRGFVCRPASELRSVDPLRIVVVPTAGSRAWVVDVGEEPPVTTVVDRDTAPGGDVLLEADPVALLLTLWNRSDEVAPGGRAWELWRDGARVRWTR